MPNSREVINLAIFMQELTNHIEGLNRTANAVEHVDPLGNRAETSMAYLRINGFRCSEDFLNMLETYYREQFDTYGSNKTDAIRNILQLVKRDLLQAIIDDPSTPPNTKDYLRINLEILSGSRQSNNFDEILLTTRNMLNDVSDIHHVAWRNFDPHTLSDGARYRDQVFVSDYSNHVLYKELLAYCYLAIKIDSHSIPPIAPYIKTQLWLQFVTQLAAIRRAHNEDNASTMQDQFDQPSCLPGTVSRLYAILNRHPLIAKNLKKILDEHSNEYTTSFISTTLETYCQNLDAELIRQSTEALNFMTSFYLRDIIDGEEEFTEELLEIHLRTLDTIGIDTQKLGRIIDSDIDIATRFRPQQYSSFGFFQNNTGVDYSKVLILKKDVILDILLKLLDKLRDTEMTQSAPNIHMNLNTLADDTMTLIRNITNTQEYSNLIKAEFLDLVLKIQNMLLDPYVYCPHIIARLLPPPVDNEAHTNEDNPELESMGNSISNNQVNVDFIGDAYIVGTNLNFVDCNLYYTDSGKVMSLTLGNASINNTGPYSDQIKFPNLPVIHPYYPNGASETNQYLDAGMPSFPVAVKFNMSENNNIPNRVRELLAQHNIGIERLEIGFCIQNMPWVDSNTGDREQLLFRPHSWLAPDAPRESNHHSSEINVLVGLMDIDGTLSIMLRDGISVHYNDEGRVVFSPNNMQIQGLDNLNRTHAFYSFCINPANGSAILTLHWLLNGEHFISLKQNIDQINFNNENITLDSIINISIAEDYWSAFNHLGSAFNPVNALRALLGAEEQPVYINYNQTYRIAGQPAFEQDIASSSNGYQSVSTIQPETSSSSNSQHLLTSDVINVISGIVEDSIVEQIDLVLTDHISGGNIVTDPVAIYNNDLAVSSTQILDRSTTQRIIQQNQRKIEHFNLLNGIFHDGSQYDFEFLTTVLETTPHLIETIQDNAPNLFFDDTHTMRALLYGNNNAEIARAMLRNCDGEDTVIPDHGEALLIRVITRGISDTKTVLANNAHLSMEQIRNPFNGDIMNISDIRSTRLFIDVILLITHRWKIENPTNNLESLEENLALQEQIDLLNANQPRLIAATNALTNIIRDPQVNTYTDLTVAQVQHLRSFIGAGQALESNIQSAEARRQQEDQRLAEAEAQRRAQEAAAAARRLQEEQAQRQAQEARRLQEEQAQRRAQEAAAAARRLQEEQAQRQAEAAEAPRVIAVAVADPDPNLIAEWNRYDSLQQEFNAIPIHIRNLTGAVHPTPPSRPRP